MERDADAVRTESEHLVFIRLRIIHGHLSVRIARERH